MAVNNATGYNRTTNEPLDALFLNSGSVYLSTAEVNARVNSVVRYPGATFNVSGSLYWYRDGIGDSDLVLFNDFKTGSLQGTSSWASNTISSSYSRNADLLDNRDSTTFANTGSNNFSGDQYVAGTVYVAPATDATLVLRSNTVNNTSRILFTQGGSFVWGLYKDSTVADFKLYNYSLGSLAMIVNVATNAVSFTNTVSANNFSGSGVGLTALPTNTAIYPILNQNTSGSAATLSAVLSSNLGGAGSVSGLMKANGAGAVSAAVAGVDYVAPITLDEYVKLSRFVMHEVPTGTINGANSVFTLANTPLANKLLVFVNGIKMEGGVGNDYVVSANLISFQTGAVPQTGDKVAVTYIY